ncbi:MAG: PAS domain-containing sensor histidine kinase, partial [Chitinophagaceae bacterium]
MDFTFNIFAFTLIFFGTLTLFLSYYLYRKEGEAVKFFGIMMLSNAVWSLGYGFELASTDIDQVLFFIKIEYFGITTLPFNWFLFCLRFSGRDKWYKKPLNMGLLSIVPIATILLVWTNEYHHIYFKNYTIDHSGGFPVAKFEGGILYFLFTAYFYILLALGNYLLFAKFRAADAMYRRQNYLIMIASLIPWIANISFVTEISPLGNIDITPFAFIATVLFISI